LFLAYPIKYFEIDDCLMDMFILEHENTECQMLLLHRKYSDLYLLTTHPNDFSLMPHNCLGAKNILAENLSNKTCLQREPINGFSKCNIS